MTLSSQHIVDSAEAAAGECATLLLRVLGEGDGDRVTLHAGDIPQLVGPGGGRPLAHRALSVRAVRSLMRHLLPVEERTALARIGATRYELTSREGPYRHFTIDASLARDGPTVTVFRDRTAEMDEVPADIFVTPQGTTRGVRPRS